MLYSYSFLKLRPILFSLTGRLTKDYSLNVIYVIQIIIINKHLRIQIQLYQLYLKKINRLNFNKSSIKNNIRFNLRVGVSNR